MLNSVFMKTLRDARGGILWWGLGLGSLGFFVGSLYPTIQESSGALLQYVEALPDWMLSMFGGGDINTVAGWANLEYLSFLPLLLATATIAACSGAFQGEEDRRTMDLLMSQPVSRRRVAIEKMAAITIATLLVTVITSVLFVLGFVVVGVEIDVVPAFLASFNAVPIALAIGALALFGSAFFPTRGLTIAVSGAVLAASYFLNAFGEVAESLRSIRPLSLYYYYASSQPMLGDIEWGHIALLLGLAAVFFVATLWAFERRELRL